MHVIAAADTWNNVSRWIPRKLMAACEMRVLFEMSANDSLNLIDSPAVTTLVLHRALFHNEHFVTLEPFRPYRCRMTVGLRKSRCWPRPNRHDLNYPCLCLSLIERNCPSHAGHGSYAVHIHILQRVIHSRLFHLSKKFSEIPEISPKSKQFFYNLLRRYNRNSLSI